MSHLPPLLSAESVHDRRHLSIWLSLTFSAGAVNAAALAACQRFVTHVTGTLTRVGADFGDLWLMVDYACVFACFVAGAMTSVFLIDGRRMRNREPWPTAPLWLVAIVLLVTSVIGLAGGFGPFGRTVETAGDFVLLSLLGFAMGLQNASVATTTGMIVRTTHMTGPVTDFSIALATALSGGPAPLVTAARRSVFLRGSKVVSFFVGAFVASLLAGHLEYASFLLPAGVTILAATMLGASLREQREQAAPAEASSWPRDASRKSSISAVGS
jgi:uncharacterized membrane protein YoaK (UPF0700 family)